MRPVRYAGAFVALVVLAGSVVLTLARVLTPGGHAWVLLTSFVPWALVGYLLAGLLLGLLCWRSRRRLLPAVGVALAAVGLLLHAFWLAPSFVVSGSASTDGVPVRVMTLNLQYGRADTDSVVRLAKRLRPDLVVLEETTPDALAGLEAQEVGSAAGSWPHQAGAAAPGASGTVVLSRYPLVEDTSFALGNGGARMEVRAPTPFTLTAVHAIYPLLGTEAWEQDFRTLTADARETPGPHLVVGDFNATLDHRPMRTLLDAGLTDAAEDAGSGWQPTWPRPGSRAPNGITVPLRLMAIDHVLMSEGLSASSTSTHVVADTDHLALVAVVRPG